MKQSNHTRGSPEPLQMARLTLARKKVKPNQLKKMAISKNKKTSVYYPKRELKEDFETLCNHLGVSTSAKVCDLIRLEVEKQKIKNPKIFNNGNTK